MCEIADPKFSGSYAGVAVFREMLKSELGYDVDYQTCHDVVRSFPLYGSTIASKKVRTYRGYYLRGSRTLGEMDLGEIGRGKYFLGKNFL